jgi:hypothetical protein
MSTELDTVQTETDATSQGESQPVVSSEQERQPVDLTKLDEFKKWQSEQDRKNAQRDSYYQQQLRAEQQARAQLEQQFHQVRMQGLDESGQLAYQNQLLQQQLAELARQRELDQYAYTRQRDLEDISRKTGVPFEKISGFNTAHEAWDFAVEEMKKTPTPAGAKAQQDAETPDPVNIGGNKTKDTASELYREWNDAMTKDYDMGKAMRLEDKAIRAGIDPQGWKPRRPQQ